MSKRRTEARPMWSLATMRPEAGDGVMALKIYVVTALFLGGVAWLWATGSQQAGAGRQAVASQYSLGAQQMTVYDKCISAMEHKGLRAGGSKQQFCGCL